MMKKKSFHHQKNLHPRCQLKAYITIHTILYIVDIHNVISNKGIQQAGKQAANKKWGRQQCTMDIINQHAQY
jgi:hypothetical protein